MSRHVPHVVVGGGAVVRPAVVLGVGRVVLGCVVGFGVGLAVVGPAVVGLVVAGSGVVGFGVPVGVGVTTSMVTVSESVPPLPSDTVSLKVNVAG